MAVSDWSTTPGANTSLEGINCAQGSMTPGSVDNLFRAMAAAIRSKFDDTDNTIDSLDTLGIALTALNAVVPSANRLPYFTGPGTATSTSLTPFARTLLDDTDAATACATLGAVRVVGYSAANPGYIRLQIATSVNFTINWGTVTAAANSNGTATFSQAYSTFSIVSPAPFAVNGATSDNENFGFVSSTTTGFTVWNAGNSSATVPYIAIGF